MIVEEKALSKLQKLALEKKPAVYISQIPKEENKW